MRKINVVFNHSLRTKLLIPVMITMVLSLVVNLMLFSRIHTTVNNMEQVYVTNIQLGALEELLKELQSDVYQYLNIQNEEALTTFYENADEFKKMIDEIDGRITDHPARRLEYHIRRLSLSWLSLADEAVQAKKSFNVVSYKEKYEEIQQIYDYLLTYMQGLNDLRFKVNSENYTVLYKYLQYLQIFIITVLIVVTFSLMMLLYIIIGTFTKPLEQLAYKAKEVASGNFEVVLDRPKGEDEVETLTTAFNQMIVSINDYITRITESMELEIKMKEQELAMETLLKDTQFKYYQAKISPHFLFNTLNAGQQLAMMEDAERTYKFMENTALFFRYMLKSGEQTSTLQKEIELIDNYMYIMNVRHSNELHLEKSLDNQLIDILFPSMVLQPIVENALNHGLCDVEHEKHIWLSVEQKGDDAVIAICDNGVGISKQDLLQLQAETVPNAEDKTGTGNGVGLANVRERLRLYFSCTDVMQVESEGIGKGACVIIKVPILRENDKWII